MEDFYISAFRPYEKAAAITGLSEIKLHKLRIAGIAKVKTSGYPDYTPLINIDDVKKWLKNKG